MHLQLFPYFSEQIETKNYKIIYESLFADSIKWGKICVKFVSFFD